MSRAGAGWLRFWPRLYRVGDVATDRAIAIAIAIAIAVWIAVGIAVGIGIAEAAAAPNWQVWRCEHGSGRERG